MQNYIRLITMSLMALCALSLMASSASAAIPFESHRERGPLQTINADARRMTVSDPRKGTQVFTWNQFTKFQEHTKRFGRSKTITAADLKPGDQVKVLYKHEGYPTVARKVIVTCFAPVAMNHIPPARTQS